MRLTIFNGSPRGEKSNTKKLLSEFCRGFMEGGGNSFEVYYLKAKQNADEHIKAFREAEHVILAFPLYTDAMPGIVKWFIEDLRQFCGRESNPTIGFIIQSGFPEAVHTKYLCQYLEKLAKRLGCECSGVVRKGGVEGVCDASIRAGRKLFSAFYELGRGYSGTGKMDPDICNKLAIPDVFPRLVVGILKIVKKLGLFDIPWNRQLKKNKAYDKRYYAPHCQN